MSLTFFSGMIFFLRIIDKRSPISLTIRFIRSSDPFGRCSSVCIGRLIIQTVFVSEAPTSPVISGVMGSL